jgi:hypothetical protein
LQKGNTAVIENLTLGELMRIAEAFQQKTAPVAVQGGGRPVIVRCRDAGVHFGELVDYEGRTVRLKNARRLWSWQAKSGVALNGVAAHGIVAGESKIDSLVESIVLLEACEIIDCTEGSAKSIRSA